MSRLGDLLRTERLRRKMTLKEVARAGGVSESYLKDVEEGNIEVLALMVTGDIAISDIQVHIHQVERHHIADDS